MALDISYIEHNRASLDRLCQLADRLQDDDFHKPIGEHWTVGVVFAHIAFWDARVFAILDATERENAVVIHPIDIIVNDLSLALWRAIPARDAIQLAITTAEELDQRLETYPVELLEQIADKNIRFIRRDYHRNAHLDEIEQALSM